MDPRLDDPEAALERAKEFSLAGVADKITCPVLITHGANDRVVPVEGGAQALRRASNAEEDAQDFTVEEGERALPGG